MAEEIIEQGYRELADTILEHNPGVDLGRVRAAFELADRAHSGQKRKAGTPYVTHCVAACLLYTSPSPRDRQKSRMPSSA